LHLLELWLLLFGFQRSSALVKLDAEFRVGARNFLVYRSAETLRHTKAVLQQSMQCTFSPFSKGTKGVASSFV
jgi:hypothetical protein